MPINSIRLYPPDTCICTNESLKHALELMLDKQVNHLAVCGADNQFIGILSTNAIIKALMPASAQVEGGLSSLKFIGDALRLLTAHLHKLETLKVGEFTKKDVDVLHEDSPILEAAQQLASSTAPLPVIGKNGELVGMLSRLALLSFLLTQDRS
jgi:CBS domain-containing protein